MQDNAIDHDRKVQDGLDFILNHFQEPLFPRRIMTKKLGYQVELFNKEEILEHFKDSNYEDCRINAYPSFTEYHGINRTPISFLIVDLDLKDFVNETKKGKAVLDRALNKTLQKIRESIGGNPTVLWTPVSGFILEEYETFYELTKYVDKDLTSMFIRPMSSTQPIMVVDKADEVAWRQLIGPLVLGFQVYFLALLLLFVHKFLL